MEVNNKASYKHPGIKNYVIDTKFYYTANCIVCIIT